MKNIKITIIIIIASVSILYFFSNISAAQDRSLGKLKNINLNRMENQLEVQIVLDKFTNYRSFTLLNPNRLVIDFFQVDRFSCDPYIEVNNFGVNVIRTAKNTPEVTRIVFDLAEKSPSYTIKESKMGLTIFFLYEEERVVEEKETKPSEKTEEPAQVKKEEERSVEKVLPTLLQEIDEVMKEEEEMAITLGLGSGAYFFHGTDLQDTYDKSSFFASAETIFNIPLKKYGYIGASLNLKYIFDTGTSAFNQEKIKLEIIPISFSALYSRKFGRFFPYIGLGLDYYNYEENFPDTSDRSSISGSTWGTNIQAGMYFQLNSSLLFKLFFKYSNARMKENNLDINLGGNEYGLAFAYKFKI
ncbi:MAG: AMIN domain-containing protein [Candidatus Aminicenantaceae bacterium]